MDLASAVPVEGVEERIHRHPRVIEAQHQEAASELLLRDMLVAVGIHHLKQVHDLHMMGPQRVAQCIRDAGRFAAGCSRLHSLPHMLGLRGSVHPAAAAAP